MRAEMALPVGLEAQHVERRKGLPAGGNALLILGCLVLAAMLGALGGTPSKPVSAVSEEAELDVTMPRIIRNGMFFEARLRAVARRPMKDAVIAMSPTLWRSITMNTQVPQADSEDYTDGRYRLHFGPLEAGQVIFFKIDAQINPDLFLGNRGEIALLDGVRPVARIPVTLTVLP